MHIVHQAMSNMHLCVIRLNRNSRNETVHRPESDFDASKKRRYKEYYAYAAMTFPSRIKTAPVRQIYESWLEKTADSRLPRRSDIRWEDLKGLASYVLMVDVLRGPLRFKIRYFGTQLVHWAGRDYTGCPIRESTGSPEWRHAFSDYRTVVETIQPRFDERKAEWSGKSHLHYERILAPLSSDGKTVDVVLGAIHLISS